MTDTTGLPKTKVPKAERPHRYASTSIQLRNLRWAVLQSILSWSPAQLRASLDSSPPVTAEKLAKFLAKPVTTVRKAVQSARADDGRNLAEEAMSEEELEEALDTPLTDEPFGPKYRDLPAVQDWLRRRAR